MRSHICALPELTHVEHPSTSFSPGAGVIRDFSYIRCPFGLLYTWLSRGHSFRGRISRDPRSCTPKMRCRGMSTALGAVYKILLLGHKLHFASHVLAVWGFREAHLMERQWNDDPSSCNLFHVSMTNLSLLSICGRNTCSPTLKRHVDALQENAGIKRQFFLNPAMVN